MGKWQSVPFQKKEEKIKWIVFPVRARSVFLFCSSYFFPEGNSRWFQKAREGLAQV